MGAPRVGRGHQLVGLSRAAAFRTGVSRVGASRVGVPRVGVPRVGAPWVGTSALVAWVDTRRVGAAHTGRNAHAVSERRLVRVRVRVELEVRVRVRVGLG